MTRASFNQDWTVRPKTSIFAQLHGDSEPPTAVTLPHDALQMLTRSAETGSAATGYYPGGAFEYTKTFDVPDEYRGKRVSVEFQGVHRDAMVFVNGAFAGQRPSGYSTFVVPLDDFLHYGETNTIRVDARTHQDSRWYTGAGIYRDTTLIVTDLVHLTANGVRVSTPDIDAGRAVVEVEVAVRNDRGQTATATVESEVHAADGTVVARGSSPVTMRGGTSAVARLRLYVTEPALWSVDDPNLYSAVTTVRDLDFVLDESNTTFGIRSLQLDPFHGLRINGQTVKLRGACIHHDNGLLGAATIGRAEERRVELLKEAGFNAIRSSHNPLSQPMLEACDRVGMLVMDETFDVWTEAKSSFDYSLAFPEWWERDVESMVAKDFNHPSVIFYSIGNEIPETGSPLGSGWGRNLAEKVRSLDSTRFVTNGINGFVSALAEVSAMLRQQTAGAHSMGGVNDVMNSPGDMMNRVTASPLVTQKTAESFAVLDVAGMNYGDGRYVMDRELFPNRVIVGSETFPPHIAANWRLVEDNAHVIGDFTWTGWDYLGEVGIGRVHYLDQTTQFEAPFPWLTAWCGDLDITGCRRPASYYRETVFGLRHTPYIAVQRPEHHGRQSMQGQWAWTDSISSWDWDVQPGSPIKVEVYSDADEVELRLNGRQLGRLPAGPDNSFRAVFDTTYQPGHLEAIAYVGSAEQSRAALQTPHGSLQLTAVPDRKSLTDGHSDLSFITIELRDNQGTLVTTKDRVVSVTVDGAGELKGLGTGRPNPTERYDTDQHSTFEGRLLAIVRPTSAGPITITVSADGVADVTLDLEAIGIEAASNSAQLTV